MITDATVRAGSVLQCSRHHFAKTSPETDETVLAVVISPTERQYDHVVEAVPLAQNLPEGRSVLYVELEHEGLKALSASGTWYALCDRPTRLSLASNDVTFLRWDRGSAVNYEPRYFVGGEDLKSIRFALVHRIFPDRDIRVYFRSGLRSFRGLTKRLKLLVSTKSRKR